MDHPADYGAGHCLPNPDGSCSICADEALLGTVLAVDADTVTAQVQFADGVVSTVALDLVGDIAAGDELMVHLGFAITRVVPVQINA